MNTPDTAVLAAIADRRIDRRGFLTVAAKGLAVAFTMPLAGRVASVRAATPPTSTDLADSYVHIGSDGRISLFFGGAEMGQGSMSGLSQILAEELKVDWTKVSVETADPRLGVSYLTGGSTAVRLWFGPLRLAGAKAREMLSQRVETKSDGEKDDGDAGEEAGHEGSSPG